MCHGKCGSVITDNLPIAAILFIVALSCYVYIYEMCILLVASKIKMICYLVGYHFFLIIFLTLYLIAICESHWEIPEKYFLSASDLSLLAGPKNDRKEYNTLLAFCKKRHIRVYMRTKTGNIRYCTSCAMVKPDRTHHCSKCGTCIMKMDHHCPWINNCVGFTNHKYFLLLVLYAAMYCTFYTGTSMQYCIRFFVQVKTAHLRQLSIIIFMLLTLSIGIALWLLLCFHLHLIFINATTLEAMNPPIFAGTHHLTFDRGCPENFKEECSWNALFWCLPVNQVKGNGTDFEVVECTGV